MGPTSDQSGLRKVCYAGTHRALTPEDTLRWIEPLFPVMGITRLADVTWLDEIGIPVYQAIRPNSWTLSVSQGKGLSKALAKVSAAMESIETWHAEQAGPGDLVATVAEMEPECGYRLDELVLEKRHYLQPAVELEWTRATRLADGADSFVPTRSIRLDGRVDGAWWPPLFIMSSNGLASGNTYEEAVLHGLYELIERDCLVLAGSSGIKHRLAIESVGGFAAELLDTLVAAGVEIQVEVLESPTKLPCFRALIWSEVFPAVFGGMGVHIDRDVALCRALTEAAQSRVTNIAGTRDDITAASYRQAKDVVTGLTPPPQFASSGSGPNRAIIFDEVPTALHEDLAEDLLFTVDRVLAYTGRSPLVVDQTRQDVGIPVVRVVSPGLHYDPALT